MKKSLLIWFAGGLLLALAAGAAAQTPPNAPPKVLSIFREEIKPGKGAAHEKLEVGYVRALERAKHPSFSLALTSLAGAGDAWFVSAYDSFEALEKDREAMQKNTALINEFERLDELDSEFRTGQRAIIAVYRDDLSYRPTVDIATMRYFEVITVRARPGRDEDFAEAAKLIRTGLEKSSRETHYAVYQVAAGMPSGTFLILVPMKTLKELDIAMDPKNQAALLAAMGEVNFKKFQRLLSDGVIVMEPSIYAFNPKMSYVSKEFAERDPGFWTPKETVARKRVQQQKGAAKAVTKNP